jgi:hypothetical protein
MCRGTKSIESLQSCTQKLTRINSAVLFLRSWFESLAVALHRLQPDWCSVSGVRFLIENSLTARVRSLLPSPFYLLSRSSHSLNSSFSLSQVLLLPRTGFATVIRPLFNQFLGGHSVKGDNCPIALGVYDWTVPDIHRD